MADVVLRASCSDEVAELVSVVLFEWGATAVGDIGTDGSARIEAGFTSMTEAQAAAAAIESWATSIEIATVEPTWIEQQRESLRPTTAGRWTVRAPWHPEDEDAGGPTIVIDPGAAFGHGGHATTRLALDLLDGIVDSCRHAVDLGTGTGVLAIAAALERVQVDAVELDPEAADTARLNVVRNDVGERVTVHHADAAFWDGGPYELGLVNVTIDVHRMLPAALASADHVILSGVLDHQVDELLRLHADRELVGRRDLDGWVAVALGSPSAED